MPEQLCLLLHLLPSAPFLPLHTAPLPSPHLSVTCQPGLSARKRHARSMSLSCEDKSQVPAPARPSLPLPQSLVHHLHWQYARYGCHSLLSGGEISLPQGTLLLLQEDFFRRKINASHSVFQSVSGLLAMWWFKCFFSPWTYFFFLEKQTMFRSPGRPPDFQGLDGRVVSSDRPCHTPR